MAYLRLSPVSNDNAEPRPRTAETWGQRRYGAVPVRRGRGGDLLLGLIAMPLGVWGLWLLLGAPAPADTFPALAESPPMARPLVFQVPPPGLRIEVDHRPPPSNHPERWGALPTATAGPVAATPLADVVPAPADLAACRDAPNLAAQMTCVDPVLAEAEQRMAAAYDAVLAAGVAPPVLGRSQARWLSVRDEAARSSPEDLLAAYQMREAGLRGAAAALERRAASVGVAASVSKDGEAAT